jgi:sugar lactone lactonase YvrE
VARAPSGDVYVADSMMHTIRRISLAGDVATLAGRPGTPGDADGAAGDARFNQPTGLAVDSAGVLYVADTGNNLIRRVTADGQVSTVAGIFGVSGSRDGLGGEALFNAPSGLAVDESGNLYVADTGNSTVRKITPQGIVSTFAGLPGVSGLRDGQGGDAWLSQPRSLAVDDSGNLYVADTGNARIRRISPSGAVSTLSLGDALLPPSSTTPPVVAAPSPAPSTPAPSPAPSGSGGGGGGGGGSTGALLALALAALVAGRALRASRVSNG